MNGVYRMKNWYKYHYLFWVGFLILFFAIDYLRFHYKIYSLIGVCYIAAFFVVLSVFYIYIQKIQGKISGWTTILFYVLWLPLTIGLLLVSSYGFTFFREKQLINNHQKSKARIVMKYETRNSFCLEYEFDAGNQIVHDKRYLEKEVWDKYSEGEIVEIIFVPDLPLNNTLK
jgi:hypothetical protein